MKTADKKMLLFWATACSGFAASAWISSPPPRARTVGRLFSSSSMDNQPFDASAYERYSPPQQFNDRSSKFDPATGLYEKGSQDPALGRELQPPMPLEPPQSLFNSRNGPQQQDRNGMMPGNNFNNNQQPNGNGRFGDMRQDGRPNEFDNNNGFNNAPNEFMMNNGFDARNGPPPGQFNNNNQPPGQFMGNEPPPGQFYGGNPGNFGPRQQGPPPPGSRQQPFNSNDPQQQQRRNNGMPGDFNDNNAPPNDGRFGDRFNNNNNGFDDNHAPNQPGRNGYSTNDGFGARNGQEPPGPFNNQPPGQFMRNEPPPGQFDGGPRSQGPPPGSQQPFFNGQQQNGMPGNNFDNNNNRFGADMQQNGQPPNDGRFGDMQNEFNNGFGGYGNDGEFGDDFRDSYNQQSSQFGQGQAQARPPTRSWDQQDNLNGRSNNDNSQLANNNRKRNNVYMNRDKPYYMQDDQRYDFGDRRRQSSLTNNNDSLKNGKPLSSLDMLEQLWEGTNRMFDSLGITSSLGSNSNSNNKRGGSSQLFRELFSSFPKMIRTSFSQMEMQPLLDTAQRYLNEDVACTTALGGNIELGNVFSQAQATSSIDGQTKQIRTNLQVSVKGSNAAGTVNVYATEQGIEGMVLQLGGQGEEYSREINVQVPKGAGFGSGAYGGGFGNNNNNNMMNNGGGGFGGNNGNWGMNTNMGTNVVDVEVIPEEERQRQAQMATQQQEPRSLPFPKDWTTPV